MFLGEFLHTIDDKGRLTIPARFRGELATGVVVTRGFDQNLMAFSLIEWENLAAKIANQPLSSESVRAFRRRVFSGAVDLNPDRQGRILLPQYLRDFANINGEVVIPACLTTWKSGTRTPGSWCASRLRTATTPSAGPTWAFSLIDVWQTGLLLSGTPVVMTNLVHGKPGRACPCFVSRGVGFAPTPAGWPIH
jgi:MraZ protein